MPLRSEITDPREYNAALAVEFRANGGRVTGDFEGRPILLLVSTGARTGRPRVTPLLYTMDRDRFVVAAANGGSVSHPAWYGNITTNPVVTIELGRESFPALARVARGQERERLFAERRMVMPRIQEYQDAAGRCIPFVLFRRASAHADEGSPGIV